MSSNIVTAVYIAASVLFILSLGGLSNQESAKRAVWYGIVGMALAVGATIFGPQVEISSMLLMMIGIGSVIGLVVAQRVEMTGMPQLVAALHTFVGLAAVFIGINSDLAPPEGLAGAEKIIHEVEIFLGVFIGAVTTTGSVVAFGKLAGIVDGKPLTLPGRNILNLVAVLACVWLGGMYLNHAGPWTLYLMTAIALVFGAHLVLAIGGADMPVVVSMLNSYSGWAAAATGFLLGNDLLIVTDLFRAQAPEIDIVITTALIPGRPAPKLWPAEMVGLMKPGSVVVDLAAEQGGNCDLTVADEVVTSENGVTIVGYTDFPSRMAAQSSSLYATNIRHMLDDLTPEKDGQIVINMEDDVIRGATVVNAGEVTYPPPAPKVQAIGKAPAAEKPAELTAEEKMALEMAAHRRQGQRQIGMLAIGGLFMLAVGAYAPASFMQHFIVFALACFVGFQVIWNVSHALHTPLMAVTNAISGIIILGALLQVGSSNQIVMILAGISVLIATINIVGGFMVTRRMLAMFQKS